MNSRPHLLNPQGLLAAMVAMTLSGLAVAETAGRVNFVNGDVVAVTADGSKRPLTRGDFINSGERIETNRGRVQIRFTDGSFLSLQPDTVFGVDNYTFSKAKPEEGSLLFNFVRGSMRTVSGAIGKVNRANYRVKTPVATIGIRGTGYAGSFRDGILLLSVNHGLVNLSNDQGSSNVGTGQTFQVREGAAPEPAPDNVTAGARSGSPSGSSRRGDADDGQSGSNGPGFVAGEQVNADGSSFFDNATGPVLADTESRTVDGVTTHTPLYSFGSAVLNDGVSARLSSNSTVRSGLIAGFTSGGSAHGGVRLLAEPPLSAGEPVSLLTYDAETPATVVNVHTTLTPTGGISFGEWTNGSLTLNGLSHTLGADRFMSYIIGTPALATPSGNLFVSYHLDSASVARAQGEGSQAGTLDHLNVGLYLGQGTADIDLKVTLGQAVYNAVATGIQASLDSSGFSVGGVGTTGTGCLSEGCSTDISGFFSGSLGELLGVNYRINGFAAGDITGVGILARDGTFPVNTVLPDLTTVVVNPDTGDKEFSPAYSFASPFTRDSSDDAAQAVLQVGATFFQTGGAQQGGLKTLSEISDGSPQVFFSSNTQFRNLTTLIRDTGNIAMGEMTDGTFTYGNTQVTLGSNQYVPYIIGAYPTALPASNLIVSYGLQNATRPRLSSGSDIAAVLNQLDVLLNLGEGTVGVNLRVTLGSQSTGNLTVYNAVAANISRPGLADASSFQLEEGELVAVGSGADSHCDSGCQVVLAGFLSGPNAESMGTSYAIRGAQGSTLAGVALLGQTGSTPVTSTVNEADRLPSIGDDTVYRGTFALDGLGGDLTTEDELTARFDFSNGGLQRSITSDLHYYGRASGEAVPVADSVHHKQTLSWGRWTSTTGSVLNQSPDGLEAMPLLDRSLHYIVGVPAATAAMTAYKDKGLTVSYSLIGGTQTSSLLAVNGSGAAALGAVPKSGTVMIDFMNSTASMALNLISPVVDNSSGSDVLTTTPIVLASNGFSGTLNAGNLNFDSLGVSFAGNACAACSGKAEGFVAGVNADMVGLAYQYTVSGPVGNIAPAPMTGVAGFEKSGSFPTNSL